MNISSDTVHIKGTQYEKALQPAGLFNILELIYVHLYLNTICIPFISSNVLTLYTCFLFSDWSWCRYVDLNSNNFKIAVNLKIRRNNPTNIRENTSPLIRLFINEFILEYSMITYINTAMAIMYIIKDLFMTIKTVTKIIRAWDDPTGLTTYSFVSSMRLGVSRLQYCDYSWLQRMWSLIWVQLCIKKEEVSPVSHFSVIEPLYSESHMTAFTLYFALRYHWLQSDVGATKAIDRPILKWRTM